MKNGVITRSLNSIKVLSNDFIATHPQLVQELIGGLRGETCHTYYSTVPTADQAFNMENIHENNEFRMTGSSDKCITLYEPAAGSFVSLETCDGRAAQEVTFDDEGHIIVGVMPKLCLTMSDVVLPGGGQ